MEKCKVLLVDDERDFLEVLTRRLGKREVNVVGVSSGEEALQYLQIKPIDVAVLDVKMPGMDGLTALREIKKLNPLIEVIMLTGHASLEVALEGMRSGAFDYLMKPAEIDELLYKIQDAHRAKTIQEEKIARLELQKEQQASEEL
ncbi:MAG: response regulator [Deltaproteobacteria bacterium]|nr:MAG: response regulator [Deltaproteobacteria bacterium]